MKRIALLAGAALAAIMAQPAAAQTATPVPAIEAGHTLLTVSAQGSSTRAPDLAMFNAGVTTQAPTATQALAENSTRMSQVIASLKRAGIADRDIQTSNLNVNPVYAPPVRNPDGSYEPQEQRIVAYQANNQVSVKQRKLADFGKVIDALVTAGANQVNGPNFMLDKPEAALDEARIEAMRIARARADLYARAAGLRVVRVISIAEGGGYSPPMPVMYRMAAEAAPPAPPPPPIAPGELEMNMGVTVQYELAP